MTTTPWLKWLLMLTLSVIFHLLLVISYFAVAEQSTSGGSAADDGENGIDIGLGQAGSYADMANQLLAEDAPVKEKAKPLKEPMTPLSAKKPVPKKIVPKETFPVKKVQLEKPLITKKMPEIAKQGDYELTEKAPLPKKEIIPNKTEATAEKKQEVTEQPTPIKKKQVQSKASIRGTGSGSNKPTGGFKGSNKDYFTHLMAWLNKYKKYPVDAKKLKKQGAVQLQFTIDPLGNVLAKSIKKSSGHQLLNQAALTMLTQAEPLPAPPEQLKRERLTLVIPINFSLITNH